MKMFLVLVVCACLARCAWTYKLNPATGELTGNCSRCLFMDKTRSEECITVLIGASTGSGFSHYNWNTGRMCLGGVEPAAEGDAEQVRVYIWGTWYWERRQEGQVIGRYTVLENVWYDFRTGPFVQTTLVNLWAMPSSFRIFAPLPLGTSGKTRNQVAPSAFARVSYGGPGGMPGEPQIGYDDVHYTWGLNDAGWINFPWPERNASLVAIASPLGDKLYPYAWYSAHCAQSYPGCIPDRWGNYLVYGAVAPSSPPAGGPIAEPVIRRRLWCIENGVATTNEQATPNAATLCNTTTNCNYRAVDCSKGGEDWYCGGGPEEPLRNKCMNNGLCYCNPRFVGSQCQTRLDETFYLNGLMAQKVAKFPQAWRGAGEAGASAADLDWSFWTCATFDPCSGGGQCVDGPVNTATGKRTEPPRCLCYAGFFGSSLEDTDAFARAFMCSLPDASNTTDLPWSSGRRGALEFRYYMMTHQCLLWRGPNKVRAYRVPSGLSGPRSSDLPRLSPAGTESQGVIRFAVTKPANWVTHAVGGYRPSLPFSCAPGFAGPGCLPCPNCRLSTQCVRSGTSGVNVCACDGDGNWIGPECRIQACAYPQLEDGTTKTEWGACGRLANPPRGRCVLAPGQTYEPATLGATAPSPFVCECDNGYVGVGCGRRLCDFPDAKDPNTYPFINNTLVCSGSALSFFPENVLVPRGYCNYSAVPSATERGMCICLPGYTGDACQLRECPRANGGVGEVCNGLRRHQSTLSVCRNELPMEEPWCDCLSAAPPLPGTPGTAFQDLKKLWSRQPGWWGETCERTWNETCIDPEATGNNTRWCNGNEVESWRMCQLDISHRLVAKDPRITSRFPPRCVCIQEINVKDALQTEQTGRYCEASICGIRYNQALQPVERDLVCRGYADDVSSGKCRRVGVPRRPPPAADPSFEVTPTIYGLCDCQPILYRSQPTLFMGSFCQTRVQGCTNPAQARDYLAARNPEPVYPCSGSAAQTRGLCEVSINPRNLPNVTDDPGGAYRCICKEGFRGDFCEDAYAVCRPQCFAGAGSCEWWTVDAEKTPLQLPYERRRTWCKCMYPTLWTPAASVGGTMQYSCASNDLEAAGVTRQCNRDWCVETGGITNLYGGTCHCPYGTAYTRVDNVPAWAALASGAVLCEEGQWKPINYLVGCRVQCPIDQDETGLECGGLGLGAVSFCSNGANVTKIQQFTMRTPQPVCTCPRKRYPSFYFNQPIPRDENMPVIGLDPYNPNAADPNSLMPYWLDEATGLCQPACGHGATWINRNAYSWTRPTDKQIECRCDRASCKQYLRESNYQLETCLGRGTWVGPGEGDCQCEGLYDGKFCRGSKCDAKGGSYSFRFGPNVCNCSHPYKTDLEGLAATGIGLCTSACVHGRPNDKTRRCDCDPGWDGPYCDVNACRPYGEICPVPTSDVPCCCVTPVVKGKFCSDTNCLPHGTLRKPLGKPAYCECNTHYFSGTNCEVDNCGILGDQGVITGRFNSAGQRCDCIAGYMPQSVTGFCSVARCGDRGTVEQTKSPPSWSYFDVAAQRMVYPNDYACRCDGPDTLNPTTGACLLGSCRRGILLQGINNTRALCQCDSGFTGADCGQSLCPQLDKTFYDASSTQCLCRYPYWTANTPCGDNICGPGSKGISATNVAGNPLQYECDCDTSRGFVLNRTLPLGVQSAALFYSPSNPPPAQCVLRCNADHTLEATAERCICQDGYGGVWCDQQIIVSPTCPTCSAVLAGAIERPTFYAILFGSLGGLLVVAVGGMIGIWAYFRRQATAGLVAPATKAERTRLLRAITGQQTTRVPHSL